VSTQDDIIRVRYLFRGVIQGVGFRPTVFRCASGLGLYGFVRNQRSEVLAEVQGRRDTVEQFPSSLRQMLPPAASLESVIAEAVLVIQDSGFRIVESASGSFSFPPIPPDLALCADCRRELLDPADRRYLYPFITCTQCGPRYSIVEDTPFDRETTSMVDFPQCPQCLTEYTDPMNRRFHAQTNACPDCGPRLSLVNGRRQVPGDPLTEAVRALGSGKIVAVQGIGGFHLAADPRNRKAMSRLRMDKERERKPFALMVADARQAARLGVVTRQELRRLESPAGPIVIVPLRRRVPRYLEAVSNTGTLGLMLPYTPLHLLLFRHPELEVPYRSLVMTSGNLKGEPIITDPAEAQEKLAGIADLFLVHDRRILFRTDDSILRLDRGGAEVLLRRSRGYVPRLVRLGRPLERTVLAAGGDLKNAPALGNAADVHLAPYIGDLEDPLTRGDFERQVYQILKLYEVRPQVVACDMHPLYHSSRWARRLEADLHVEVQHHHAHILSVMAEHNLEETLGLSFDGTGYGTDGTIWGGEFLVVRRDSFRRLGWFAPFRLPGSEAAIRHPLRIALSLMSGLVEPAGLEALFCGRFGMAPAALETLLSMIAAGLNAPLCSSLGRLFDAAAALLGLVERVSYEGEGPIRLEGLALERYREEAGNHTDPGPAEQSAAGLVGLEDRGDSFVLDAGPLLGELGEALRRDALCQAPQERTGSVLPGRPANRGAAGRRPGRMLGPDAARLALLFHREIAWGALLGARWMREATGVSRIALSGGVFQNVLLQELLVPALRRDGFEVFRNRLVPAGDGGISLGQVYFLPGSV